jgi:hypothetical protein
MGVRALAALVLVAIAAGFHPSPVVASALDGSTCLDAAETIEAGKALSQREKEDAHRACRRALEATGSIVQKQQFEEADFAITGQRHKY